MLLTTRRPRVLAAQLRGRLLALLLSVYAVSIFGYLAATLASYFIDRDAESRGGAVAGQAAIEALRAEVAALRDELRSARTPGDGGSQSF
jgi:voltage-gated potassium channel